MGHNPSHNRIRQARFGVDTQAAVDEYKSRSVWGAWWTLDERVRRRYFTHEERRLVTRYGARLDELACHRSNPRDEGEQHFLRVCVGEEEPSSPLERLWLLVQLVCKYERVVKRAARTDLAEHDATVLRAENAALKAAIDHLERHVATLDRELHRLTGHWKPIANVVWMTSRFRATGVEVGPAPRRFAFRPAAIGVLTASGIAGC